VRYLDATQFDSLEEAFEAQYRPTPEQVQQAREWLTQPLPWGTSPSPSPTTTSPSAPPPPTK
jgi:hypothetical protein